MQWPSQVASQAFAKRARGVEADIDVHVAECTAFHLEHAVCGEVAETAVEPAQRITERSRFAVNGDVCFRLHTEQRSEPTRADGMAGKSLQRMASQQRVSVDQVLSLLRPT